ncbi:hypothetical protein ABGB18_41610 [Nonomuraea sp. B12E4]|uniref:hypothetical protein n=1 Tax=Nonomuraea sp. B12E4 TaxID=3153564 RepID=UPI00325C71B2
MRIRLEGSRAELTLGLIHLREAFAITSMSRAYPDRSHPGRYRLFLRISPKER